MLGSSTKARHLNSYRPFECKKGLRCHIQQNKTTKQNKTTTTKQNKTTNKTKQQQQQQQNKTTTTTKQQQQQNNNNKTKQQQTNKENKKVGKLKMVGRKGRKMKFEIEPKKTSFWLAKITGGVAGGKEENTQRWKNALSNVNTKTTRQFDNNDKL
jgi:hypothetical protein